MTKSIKEAMEDAGYVEIDKDEFINMANGVKTIDYSDSDRLILYFKKEPEPKFPKVFEDRFYKIIVINVGIGITPKSTKKEYMFGMTFSLPLLIEAVKYWEANKDD